MFAKIRDVLLGIVQKYPVVVAGIFIYCYYLTTTLNFFGNTGKAHRSFLDFVLEFDSLIWMWLAAFAFIKLQGIKEKFYKDEKEKLIIRHELELSTIASNMLKDITVQLQDEINNPLAVINVVSGEMRKRNSADPEISKRLDQIDSAIRRIHLAIKDVASYQSSQLLSTLQKRLGVDGKIG